MFLQFFVGFAKFETSRERGDLPHSPVARGEFMARLEEGVGGIYCSGGRSWDSHPRARPGIDLDVLFAFPPFFPLQFLYLSRSLLLSFPSSSAR